jgi:hypothetical protein
MARDREWDESALLRRPHWLAKRLGRLAGAVFLAYPSCMACRSACNAWGFLPALVIFSAARLAGAQSPSGAAFPADPAPAPTPAPPPPPPAAAAPAPAPAPAPVAPPAPAPAPVPQPAAAPAPAAAPVPQPYAADPTARPGYGATYGEPPLPPAPPEKESSIPPFSVRLDPLNWILEGQLGFELEVGLAKWLTLETVPMFVTDESPPLLNLGGGDSRIYQHSNGLGPLAGATLGVNFWPSRAFKGYVIRTGLINYGLSYETKDDAGNQVDSVSHTKREFYAMFGSMERWGAFTLAGGFGLGYDLNKESRCFPTDKTTFNASDAKPGNCDEIQIAVPAGVDSLGRKLVAPIPVTPFTYPWEILARISLGVTID